MKEAAAESFRNRGSNTWLLNRKKQLGKMAPVELDKSVVPIAIFV